MIGGEICGLTGVSVVPEIADDDEGIKYTPKNSIQALSRTIFRFLFLTT